MLPLLYRYQSTRRVDAACADLNGTLGHSELDTGSPRRHQVCCYILHDKSCTINLAHAGIYRR